MRVHSRGRKFATSLRHMSRSAAGRPLLLAAVGALGAALVTAGLLGMESSSESATSMGAGQPLRTGVLDPSSLLEYGPAAAARIKGTGATYARITISWRSVAPSSEPRDWAPENPTDPHYSWGVSDRMVRQIARAGLTPVVAILETPPWASRYPRCGGREMCAPTPREYRQFATAAALRYSGQVADLPRVRYWQAWNEPNLSYFFLPQRRGSFDVTQEGEAPFISPYLYRGLVNALAAGVKSVSPGNLVIAGGTQPWATQEAVGALAWMRAMLCMKGRRDFEPKDSCGARSRFDIWGTHPYTNGPPNYDIAGFPDDVSIIDLPRMEALLRAAEAAGRIRTSRSRVDFWVDEFSWDTNPPDPHGTRWRLHARWTANALYRMWKAGVSTVIWFQLRDDAIRGVPHGAIYESGLYLRGRTIDADRPKPVLRAFRFPVVGFKRPNGIYVWGRAPDSKGQPVGVEAHTGRGWRSLGTLPADRFGIFRGLLPTARQVDAVRARVTDSTSLPYPLKGFKVFYRQPFGIPPDL
jgi:hypothetical protein